MFLLAVGVKKDDLEGGPRSPNCSICYDNNQETLVKFLEMGMNIIKLINIQRILEQHHL